MSLRSRVLGIVEVLLRVPPLFVIDEILKIGLGLSEYQDFSEHDLTYFGEKSELADIPYTNATQYFSFDAKVSKYIILSVIRLGLGVIG